MNVIKWGIFGVLLTTVIIVSLVYVDKYFKKSIASNNIDSLITVHDTKISMDINSNTDIVTGSLFANDSLIRDIIDSATRHNVDSSTRHKMDSVLAKYGYVRYATGPVRIDTSKGSEHRIIFTHRNPNCACSYFDNVVVEDIEPEDDNVTVTVNNRVVKPTDPNEYLEEDEEE